MKNSNFHLRSLIILIFVFIVFGSTKAQTTPESCSCRLDTLGLRSYLNTLTLSENTPLRFEVQSPTSTFAVLHGTIGSTTPTVTQTFIDTYPNVTTLVMMQIPGSNDDTANLDAALRLRNRGSSVYDRYYQRKEINNEQFQAASMYYKSYYIGHEKTSIIPKYKERLGGGSIPTLTPNEHQEHHRQMYEKARKSLPGELSTSSP